MSTLVTVNVRNIAVGGAGVGEVMAQGDGNSDLLGITAFVPFSAVGEVVAARVTEHKKRYLNTELVEIERGSPDRVTPDCRYFGVCGGCELQHISYPGQLASKWEMISSALKAGRLSSEVLNKLEPVIPGDPYHYRRRVALHIDRSGKVGFYRESSRSVVAVQSCAVAVPVIDSALSSIQELGKKVAGKISSLLLEADERGVVAVLKAPLDLTAPERQNVLAAAKEYFSNVVLMVGEREVGGFGRQILELPLTAGNGLMLRVPAGRFTQVNWGVNRKLIDYVLEHSLINNGGQFNKGSRVLDLYAGAGNFALPLARAGATVTAVEADKRLALFCRESATKNGLDRNLEVVEGSVERFLDSPAGRKKAACILADPPRSGLGQLVSALSNAERFLLVSCYLPSFVRDLRGLTAEGWRVERIQPFDMFAQTSYVEILGVMSR